MAERTYKFGYPVNGVYRRLTLAEMNTKWTWTHLHPEMRRRILAMMNEAQDAGRDPGVGEGARSTELQRSTFLLRHAVVASGGCCSYQGKRYQLRKGYAHAAPPGSSVHEDQLYEGFALAVDMVGWEDHWFDQNCNRFGLKNFGGAVGPNVNNEEWHHQPMEFANSRSAIISQIKAGGKLQVWPLGDEPDPPPVIIQPPPTPAPTPLPPPTDPTKDEDMPKLVLKDSRPPHAVWLCDGNTKTWVRDGDAANQLNMRLVESGNGARPSPVDGFFYRELVHGSDDVIASYGPIIGPIPGGFDSYGRKTG